MGARDVVVVVEVRADARGDRLLADVHVHEAGDLAGAELARDPLLEEPDREHRPVEAEQRRGVDRLARRHAGCSGRPATSARTWRGTPPPGPPSTARWSKVRQACIVGRTAIAAVADHDRAVADAADPEDPDLRRVEDRRRDVDRVDAAVRDGERAAVEVVRRQRAVARARRELGDALVDLLEREPVGAGDDRRDEPLVRLDGDGDVDLAEQLDLALGHARVQSRMLAEGGGDELHDDRGDADPRASRPASLSRLRSSTSGLTSSSSTEVSWAEVWRLATIRVAIVLRRPRSGIVRATVSSARLACGAGAATGSRAAAHAVTSRSRMRPPGPGAGDLAGVVEREAELLQQRPRARRDERRAGPPGRRGRAPSRGRSAGTAPAVCATAAPPPCADVAEERVAVLAARRPSVGRAAGRERRVLLARLGDQRHGRADGNRLAPRGRGDGRSRRSRPRPRRSSSRSRARARPSRARPRRPRRRATRRAGRRRCTRRAWA